MTYKIQYYEDKCIGCGSCKAVCEENWDIIEKKGAYKAEPKKTELKDLSCNQDAADACPVEAIKIVKK
ncbi:ferredoxin [Candidatus Woesearchaeota archaeon]|nr:ferredoxin [Candidatus Woesearchaeota archaeon]